VNALWLHLRTSPLRYALPPLVALDIAVLFLRNQHWFGTWPETGAAGQIPAYLIGVLGAGGAAWAASAPDRHRLGEQLAAARVSPARRDAHRLGATFLILLIPYLVGQALAFAITARTFPPGVHLWLGYVLLGVFVLMLATAVGWACGRLLPTTFGALLAAVGFLFMTSVLGQWAGFVVISGRPEVAVDPVPLALRLSMTGSALLIMVRVATDTGRRHRGRASILLLAFLPLLAVMFTTDAVTHRQSPGDAAVCVDGRTRICLWPEHEKYLPQMRDLASRIQALPSSFIVPARIEEEGLTNSTTVSPDGTVQLDESGPPTFSILEGSPWSYASDVGIAINAATLGTTDPKCSLQDLNSTDHSRIAALDAWIEAYLVGGATPDYQTDATSELAKAWAKGRAVAAGDSPADQFRWAESEMRDLRGRYCRQVG
jgi:hypothetical protein